ncbi:helix-turn-helix domain-containing protein [Dactylosporangium sp. CA-152071]|uniref:helix-turn-helix domain-containing protein n=1 Tax=Dactylosporangium sp. CA-152071 TaxID=3239933 RepID=UPI003D8D6B83
MAQASAELQPFASLRHYLGAELRAWRLLRGYSLARLGSEVHVSGDLLGKIEKAQRRPADDLIARCDDVLDAGGALRRLHGLTRRGLRRLDSKPEAPAPAGVSISSTGRPTYPDWAAQTDGGTAEVVNIAAYRRRRIASAG